jgi:biotin transporter BioY
MKMDHSDKALEHFKDWSNYLLLTTVAAMGWIIDSKAANPHSFLWVACVLSLAASILFGILTLALIPLIQEQRKASESIYKVKVQCWICGNHTKLKCACLPHHVLFIGGIGLYAAAWVIAPPC